MLNDRGYGASQNRLFQLKATESWIPLNWNINFQKDLSSYYRAQLDFCVSPGDGEIYLDDIELIESASMQEPTPATYTGNLLKNGDFIDKDDCWDIGRGKFKGRILKEDGNRYLAIKADSDAGSSSCCIKQVNFSSQCYKKFRIRFKYKTSEAYSGDGFRIMSKANATRGSLDTKKKTFGVTVNEDWKEVEWEISHPNLSNKSQDISLYIYVLNGDGEIYFDDFEVLGIP